MALTKNELITTLQDEVRILVHLCGKVQPEMLDYRPTTKQRSLIELLRYLTVMGPVLVPSIKGGQFLVEAWNTKEGASKAMDLEAVVASLGLQSEFYAQAVGEFTEEELAAELEMFGLTMSRGRWLVTIVLSGHVAYRTQLFCYLKSCGLETLNTMNLWRGLDAV